MQLMKLKSSEGKTEAIIREHIIIHTLEKWQWLVQFPQPSGEWQRFGRQLRWWVRSARAICHVDGQGVWHPGEERGRDALNSLPPQSHGWIKPSGQYCLPSPHPKPPPRLIHIIFYLYQLKPCFPVLSLVLCSVLLHKDLLEEVILLSSVKKAAECGQHFGRGDEVRILHKFLLKNIGQRRSWWSSG